MGLLFRFALIVLFGLGAYAVNLTQPEAFERPEALLGAASIGAAVGAVARGDPLSSWRG